MPFDFGIASKGRPLGVTGLEEEIPGICSLSDRAGDEARVGYDGGETDRDELGDGLRAWSGRAKGAGERERGLLRGPIGLDGVGIESRM